MPDMPPEPFFPGEGYAYILQEFRGLRRFGAGMIEAAVITAAHITVNAMAVQEQQQPDGELPGA